MYNLLHMTQVAKKQLYYCIARQGVITIKDSVAKLKWNAALV